MTTFSLVVYFLSALGVMQSIQLLLLGLLVIAVVLYFMKRA